jgi:hypothetical protein
MKRITIAFTLAIVGLSFASCKKYGCTDPDAINFEEKVRSNNLVCEYEGSILFYYDAITQDYLIKKYGLITSLEYYVDEVRVDSIEFENPQDKLPRCGSKEVATFVDSMSTGAARWVEYRVNIVTPGGIVGPTIYDSIVSIKAAKCLKIELD